MALHEHDIAFKQPDIALCRFHSDTKQFILTCRRATIAAKLPSTDRRDKLEEVAWGALQDAVE